MGGSPVASKHFENEARREWWSVHVEAWRRSGLSQSKYCRAHRLTETTFNRWLKSIDVAQTARTAAELLREQRRLRRRGGPAALCKSKRSVAVQAFWALHIEALTWSGMAAAHYAAAHHISANSLRRWRDLLESGEVEVDWRAHLHPSARPPISTSAKGSANDCAADSGLTTATDAESRMPQKQSRRSFTAEEKLTIVLETERAGETVSSVARRHGIVASVVFRWRAELGFGKNRSARLAAVTLGDGRTGASSMPLVLHDLLQPPDGMAAVDLPDGRRVFAPVGSDPETVRRHVSDREAAR
jgi:transposase-like protein